MASGLAGGMEVVPFPQDHQDTEWRASSRLFCSLRSHGDTGAEASLDEVSPQERGALPQSRHKKAVRSEGWREGQGLALGRSKEDRRSGWA